MTGDVVKTAQVEHGVAEVAGEETAGGGSEMTDVTLPPLLHVEHGVVAGGGGTTEVWPLPLQVEQTGTMVAVDTMTVVAVMG